MAGLSANDPGEDVLSLRGLDGPARVARDRWGVPHVRAASERDAFFLNGYVHAQDRLWQMDAARRRAVGRFAEWAGPAAAPADGLARRLDVAGASRRDAAALSPRTDAMLERYAAGVNAWAAANRLPPEYGLLNEGFEPWEPWHCVAVMRQRGLLMGSLWFKLWRAAALSIIGPENVALLRYDDGGEDRFVVPQGAHGRRWRAALDELGPALQGLAALAAPDAAVAGSNNWALAGSHTASGRPLVAGDPHRAFEIPGMYVQLHLACDAFDALGLSIPGVPAFPHFGHTDAVAWCVTHAFADIHDLYVERFDVGRYATEEGWARAAIRDEVVRVRGGEDVAVRCAATRHGPVIVGEPADGHAIALRSVQLDAVDRSLDCLIPMLEAGTLAAFYEATSDWGVIDHNLVGADTHGRVGVSVRAQVPRRDRLNGWLPVPGWSGAHEWRGMIPFEEMPREVDPPSGRVVSANNRLVPESWPDYICTDCHPSTRADRIAGLLEALEPAGAEDMAALLRDVDSARAREIAARVAAVGAEGPAARAVQDLLRGWDGRMGPDDRAPAAYILIRQEATRVLARLSGLAAAEDAPAARVPPGIPAINQLWWTLPNLLRENDTGLLGGSAWEDLLAEALERVAGAGEIPLWGELHRPRFAHPLDGAFAGSAALPAPSSARVGGDGDCVCATGIHPSVGPQAGYGPIARYVFDLGDWDRSLWVVFHGASGVPGDPHYDDQNALWARGGLIPAPYTEAAVLAHAASVTRLAPAAA